MKKQILITQRLRNSLAAVAAVACLAGARADEISDWNQNAFASVGNDGHAKGNGWRIIF